MDYIKLTPTERGRASNIMRECFYLYCDDDVTRITTEIQTYFIKNFDAGLSDDDLFYTLFDKYKDLHELYTELTYHHMLYKKGTTRRDWFRRVCKSNYFDGGC